MQEILTDDPKSAATHVLLSKLADIWLPNEEDSTKTQFMNSLIPHINYWLNERAPEGQRRKAEEQARLKREREERQEQTRNIIRRWRPPMTEEERQAREAHLAEWRKANAKKRERNAEIVKLREQSITYAAIGQQFGISIGRVRQIWFSYLRSQQKLAIRRGIARAYAEFDSR